MIARNGELVEERLRQCSLYDPMLDLAVEDTDGRVADRLLTRPAPHGTRGSTS